MSTAEDVEGKVAVAAVVAVEEAALLRAVNRIVRGIEIKDQLLRSIPLPVEEDLDEKAVYGVAIEHDPAITILLGLTCQTPLQPVQRALARQRFSSVRLLAPISAERISFPRQNRQQRILAQLLVIAQILVTEGDSVHPLAHELLDAVLDQPGVAIIGEACRQPTKNSPPALHLGQQQRPTVRADPATVETGLNLPPTQALKLEAPEATVCRQGLALLLGAK